MATKHTKASLTYPLRSHPVMKEALSSTNARFSSGYSEHGQQRDMDSMRFRRTWDNKVAFEVHPPSWSDVCSFPILLDLVVSIRELKSSSMVSA